MGNIWAREFREGPEVTPRQESKPTFDPMLGFEQGRKPRVMTVTEEVRETLLLRLLKRNEFTGLEASDKLFQRQEYANMKTCIHIPKLGL